MERPPTEDGESWYWEALAILATFYQTRHLLEGPHQQVSHQMSWEYVTLVFPKEPDVPYLSQICDSCPVL